MQRSPDPLDLILDAFPGAQLMYELQPQPPALKPKVLDRERGHLTADVRACEACSLRSGCSAPVPFSAPAQRLPGLAGGVLFAVMGEGPGSQEDQRGKPFIGPSGKLLRGLMKQAGFNPDHVFYFNAVSCYPHTGRLNMKGDKSRPPTMEEMWKCRKNMERQLKASHTRFLLLAGATALHTWRDDLAITRVHGRVFLRQQSHVVMPIHHPAAALRDKSKGKDGLKAQLLADLKRWRQVIYADNPTDFITNVCAYCSTIGREVDLDGVWYCGEHWSNSNGTGADKREWNITKWQSRFVEPPKRRGKGRQSETLFD